MADEGHGLLDAADALRQRVRGFADAPVGTATIGLSPTIGRSLGLPLALRVQTDYPRLRLRVAEAFSGTLLEWLCEGRIDAAILYHQPANPAIVAETVANEALSLIGGVGNLPFPPGQPVPLVELAKHPLVLSTPEHGLRRMIERYAAAAGVTLALAHEFDSLESTIALVRRRMALTILPEAAVRADLLAGTLVTWPIIEPELIRPLVVATGPRRAEAAEPRQVATLLRDVIGEAAGEGKWRLLRG